ncbi:E3 ubiquitin-protein ligase MUL1 [Marchantia polymorpha subsp. ruderalis]
MSHHDEELCAVITRMALAGDGVVLGLGMAVLAVRTWLKFRSHSKALKQVQETPLTRIADLRSLILQKDDKGSIETPDFVSGSRTSTVSRKDVSTIIAKPVVKSVAHADSKLVIVRGRVYTTANVESSGKGTDSDSLVTQNGHERGVYLEKTQTYMHTEMNSLLGWITQKDLITLTRRMVPFVLAGSDVHSDASQSKEVYVHVQLDDPPKHPLPLVTVYHKLHPVPASSYTFFQAMFGRRYPVGLLDEEKILPLGKEITAVGLITASPDGNPIIYSCKHLPCFLTEGTREQLVTELASGTKVLLWTGIAMSTVALGILGYAFVKNWTKYKARQRDRQRRDEERQQDSLLVEYELEDITDVPDGELCIVCLVRRRRAAFIFCGHRLCCVSCAQRVEQGANPRCPVCRQSVTGYVRVFDS